MDKGIALNHLKSTATPTAPLWHMTKVGLFGSQDSYTVLQDEIDQLTQKAKRNKPFEKDEREFLKNVFESLWWGGHAKGCPEAARLADHYVNGGGTRLKIDAEVYSTSVIVRDTQKVMKELIQSQLASKNKKPFVLISTEPRLMKMKTWRALFRGHGRDVNKEGYLIDNGMLLTEQNNRRLKNADNRFRLSSISQGEAKAKITTTWRVNSYWDFASFVKSPHHVTNIPLSPGMTLKLPDGLSHHMAVVGIAKEFSYFAEWEETWEPKVP